MRLVFEKRKATSISAIILVPLISFAVSLCLTALLLTIFGADPPKTHSAMAIGAFGSLYGFAETL